MTSNFSARFDAAYHAWLDKKYYLEAKPGFYWEGDRLIGEALDPCDLEVEAIEVYDAPVTDFEEF